MLSFPLIRIGCSESRRYFTINENGQEYSSRAREINVVFWGVGTINSVIGLWIQAEIVILDAVKINYLKLFK